MSDEMDHWLQKEIATAFDVSSAIVDTAARNGSHNRTAALALREEAEAKLAEVMVRYKYMHELMVEQAMMSIPPPIVIPKEQLDAVREALKLKPESKPEPQPTVPLFSKRKIQL